MIPVIGKNIFNCLIHQMRFCVYLSIGWLIGRALSAYFEHQDLILFAFSPGLVPVFIGFLVGGTLMRFFGYDKIIIK